MKHIALVILACLLFSSCARHEPVITADPDGTLRQDGEPLTVELSDGSKAVVSVDAAASPTPNRALESQRDVTEEEANARRKQEREDRLNVMNARLDNLYSQKTGDYQKDKHVTEEIRILEYERDLLKMER